MNKFIPTLTKVIHGGLLFSSPIWYPASIFVTLSINDLYPIPPSYISSIISLSATPFTLLFTFGYLRKYGFNKKIALTPLVPISASYISLKSFEYKPLRDKFMNNK